MPDDLSQPPEDRAALLAEAYKRGLLPPDMRSAYEEAQSRGLVKSQPSAYASSLRSQTQPGDTLPMSVSPAAIPLTQPQPAAPPEDLYDRLFPRPDKAIGDTADIVKRSLRAAGEALTQGGGLGPSQETMAEVGKYLPDWAAKEYQGFGMLGDAALRGVNAVSRAASGLAAAAVPGSEQSRDKLEGDLNMMQQVAPVAAAELPTGIRPVDERPVATPEIKTANTLNALRNKAADKVSAKLQEDFKGEGTTAQKAMDQLAAGRAAGKPLTLADIGGENTRGLLGKIYRTPGPPRSFIRKALTGRDDDAGPRIDADIGNQVATGSIKQTAEQLMKARSQNAKEPWAEAMEGGSIAPLEKQFESHFKNASVAEADAAKKLTQAQNNMTLAKAGTHDAGDNVYVASKALDQQRSAEAEMKSAQDNLKTAQESKQAILERLRAAQADRTAGAKGAVWNPRIQEFLDNPRIKQGIIRGLRIERDNALAEGRPMNPTEYAVVGTDPAGEPIVGTVPNMKLLAVAKEGLDRMIQGDEFRNPFGQLNKEGVALDKVRASFLKELDAVNPDYKAAREQWSGDTASMEALRDGRDHFMLSPEEGAAQFAGLSKNDKEFYRLGVADKLKEMVSKKGLGADEAKAVIGNRRIKDQIRPLFPSDAAYDRFVKTSLGSESRMFDTKYETMGNSKTAQRQQEDAMGGVEDAIDAAHVAGHVASHNYMAAASKLLNLVRRVLDARAMPLNDQIARLLLDPNQGLNTSPGMSLIEKFPGVETQNMLARMGRRALPPTAAIAPQQQPPNNGQ